jgi:hypothetical protein
VIICLTQGTIFLNIGVLGLFIGIGLLRFSRGWRTCALAFLWIALIGLPLAALAFLFLEGAVDYTLFGRRMGEAPRVVGVTLAAALFALALWQYRVLTRPDIRKVFGVSAEQRRCT